MWSLCYVSFRCLHIDGCEEDLQGEESALPGQLDHEEPIARFCLREQSTYKHEEENTFETFIFRKRKEKKKKNNLGRAIFAEF